MPRYLVLVVMLLPVITCCQVPVVNSFSPASGAVGTIVTINGANFSATPVNNIVYFGGIKASVSSATATVLTVTVPDGATPQPISVTTNNLTGYSKAAFLTTFSGGSADFISSSFSFGADLTTGLYPFAVCASDLDGDGKPDLISPGNANSPTSLISYRRNIGTAGSLSFAGEVDLPAPAGSFPYSMVTSDLDGDGRLDVVFTASIGSLCVYPNNSSPGTIAFGARLDYATGSDPFSVAVGDFDGDGKPDLVVSNFFSNSISIYRNISTVGSIAFAPRIDLTTALAPHAVAIADLDGDGKPDLAAAATFGSAISLFRNQSTAGSIAFATRTDIATASDEPFGLAIDDIDRDGRPDLVVTYNNFNQTTQAAVSFSTFINGSSPGSFAFGAPQHNGSGDSYNPSLGDLNGDGKPDLVVPTFRGDVYIYPNKSAPGSITLGAPGDYKTPSGYAVAISDLDGDHLPDIAIANFTFSSISFFKNTSTAPGIASISPTIGTAGRTVTITGVNLGSVSGVSFGGVPAASFAVVSSTTVTAVVGSGATGDVTLTTAIGTASIPGFTYMLPATITSVSPAAAGSGTTVAIYGTHLSPVTAVSFGGVAASSFTISADTLITAVVGTGASGDIVVVAPANSATLPGAFTFIPAPTLAGISPATAGRGATIMITGTNLSGASSVTLGGTPVASFTVNSPVSITAVVGGGSTGSLNVSTPGGNSTLAGFTYSAAPPPVITSFSPTSGRIGSTMTIAGSGFDPVATNDVVYFGAVRATVIAASSSSLTVTVPAGASLRPVSLTTLSNNLTAYSAKPFNVTFDSGAIQFAWPNTYQVGTEYNLGNICAGDLDGDGKADLVIAAGMTNQFDILQNTSTGVGSISFTLIKEKFGMLGNRAPLVADLDGDGNPDVAILGYDTVYVFRNSSTPGSISFDSPVKFLTGFDAYDLAIADLDGDGRPELISVNNFISSISILRNTCVPGLISFADKKDYATGNPPQGFTSGSLPTGVAVADFDGDGKKDLAVSLQNDNKVLVFQNQCTPGNIVLGTPLSLPVGANPSGIAAGDLDGDGRPDIATSNYSDNTISVIRNESSPGNFVFAPSIPYGNNFVVQAFSIRLAMADMDGDGKLDLAQINQVSPGDAAVFRNNSTPGNILFTYNSGLPAIITARSIGAVMQDLDGDGRPDLATANTFFDPAVCVLRNQSGEQPVISAISPVKGTDTSTIVITGKNFDSTSYVGFGGFPAKSYTIVSSTVITATPPVNSSGTVTVTTPRGTASLDTFFYAAAPIVNGFTPINATTGNTVTIKGDNFFDATAVGFGGTPAASFTVVDANTISAAVGPGATGNVSVTTAFGTGTLGGFTYLFVPTLTSFTPTAGGPGTVVTITGTNFTKVTNVRFGQVEADTFTVVSPTTITAIVGSGATGIVSVTNDGWSNYLDGFTFDPSVKVSALGATNFCQGGSVVLQSSSPLGNQWYQDGVAIAGATADTLLVSTSGNYSDRLTFPNLSLPSSASIPVTVNPMPPAPVITLLGNELLSSASTGNQWYRDTVSKIPGAINQVYVPADSGLYAVKVTLNGCTGSFSDPYFFHLPVKTPDTTAANGVVMAVPNPVIGDRTQIKYSFPGITSLIAELADMQGHILLTQPDFPSGGFIVLTRLPKGIYVLRLRDSDGKTYGKVSILKWR